MARFGREKVDLSKEAHWAPAAATRKLVDQMLFLLATCCPSCSPIYFAYPSVIASHESVGKNIARFGQGKVDLSKKTARGYGLGPSQNCWCCYWQPCVADAARLQVAEYTSKQ